MGRIIGMARTPKARSAKRPSTTSKGRGAKKPATKKRATKARVSAATRVMGVAVPKTLTNALDGLVNSPRGREILASAIVAAASEAANEVGDQVASVTKDLIEVAAGAVADIVTGAARSLLPASVTGGNAKKRGDR